MVRNFIAALLFSVLGPLLTPPPPPLLAFLSPQSPYYSAPPPPPPPPPPLRLTEFIVFCLDVFGSLGFFLTLVSFKYLSLTTLKTK